MLATTMGAGERRASFLTWCKGFCLINHERVMTRGWHAITQRVKVRQENCKNLQGLKRLGKCVLGHHYLLLSHCKSHCMLSQTKVGLAFSFTCLYYLFFWIRCLVFSHHAITITATNFLLFLNVVELDHLRSQFPKRVKFSELSIWGNLKKECGTIRERTEL